MIIKDAILKGTEILRSSQIENSRSEAILLLCSLLNKDKSYVWSFGEVKLSEFERASFFDMIRQRASRKPLQYIIKKQEFMSLIFEVNSCVLIPRHDTEVLVEYIIGYCMQNPHKDYKILDIGTGSGCIAISLAKYIPNSIITAIDICEYALDIAQKNALRLQVHGSVKFVQSDLFENINTEVFDIIVSNPPYIPISDIESLAPEVRQFEPHIALTDFGDGLDFYRNISKTAYHHLCADGILVFEVGINQADLVKNILSKKYSHINSIIDIQGIQRVVACQKNSHLSDCF